MSGGKDRALVAADMVERACAYSTFLCIFCASFPLRAHRSPQQHASATVPWWWWMRWRGCVFRRTLYWGRRGRKRCVDKHVWVSYVWGWPEPYIYIIIWYIRYTVIFADIYLFNYLVYTVYVVFAGIIFIKYAVICTACMYASGQPYSRVCFGGVRRCVPWSTCRVGQDRIYTHRVWPYVW